MAKRFLLPLLLVALLFPAHYGNDKFVIAVLQYDGRWDTRLHSIGGLALQIMSSTSVDLPVRAKTLRLSDEDLFYYPFLMMTGDRAFSPFSEAERRRLRLYLESGGFLFIDNSSGEKGGEFDRCVRRELQVLFPDKPLSILPGDHTLYRSFYLNRKSYFGGRLNTAPYLEGITMNDVTPVIYSLNDAAGAWEKNEKNGEYRYDVIPGGEAQRHEAFKLGTNLVMYALTVNYKKDAVHVQTLLKRGRFRSLPWTP
ncbi:MAG: hypothetical protein A2293_10435 [Elusimicrobia bacterium RIFOXYB2_FULL_49_7]|nr:MAG: hypothetical protein A2293_10435 [Elusimicrobia bacterium RIFOXYB2_FULL_49_7]